MRELMLLADFRQTLFPIAFVRQRVGIRSPKFFDHFTLWHKGTFCPWIWNLSPLDTQPTLWATTDAERWGVLDEAAHKLNTQFSRPENPVLMTGVQLALRQLDKAHEKALRLDTGVLLQSRPCRF